MSEQPHIGINWKKLGGRKFVAAFVVFITAITNAIAGNVLDINSLIVACLGFITFIVVEGVIDFKAINKSETSPQKAILSGGLKKKLENMESLLRKLAPAELAEMELNKKT